MKHDIVPMILKDIRKQTSDIYLHYSSLRNQGKAKINPYNILLNFSNMMGKPLTSQGCQIFRILRKNCEFQLFLRMLSEFPNSSEFWYFFPNHEFF